jgi:hypothetical protein
MCYWRLKVQAVPCQLPWRIPEDLSAWNCVFFIEKHGVYQFYSPKKKENVKVWIYVNLWTVSVRRMFINFLNSLFNYLINTMYILQAALPQSIASFVFAKEYGLHADVLSTA